MSFKSLNQQSLSWEHNHIFLWKIKKIIRNNSDCYGYGGGGGDIPSLETTKSRTSLAILAGSVSKLSSIDSLVVVQ